MSGLLIERAPAKVNLTLHVPRRRDDGWHELESLVVFSRSGDLLTLDPAAPLSLTVEGPRAAAVGPDADNLVLKAVRQLAARADGLHVGAFRLVKRLPAAAGLGGGSSDAAAALRLLARLNGFALDDPRLMAAAKATGADVPVCLGASARVMRGVGDELDARLELPALFALLVNPGVAVETKRVFAEMGLRPGETQAFGAKHPTIDSGIGREALFAALKKARNDMEDAACVIAPVVGHVLSVLSAARGARLARMSGSGATCFALFEDCAAAARAARVIRRDHPSWWVKTAVLG